MKPPDMTLSAPPTPTDTPEDLPTDPRAIVALLFQKTAQSLNLASTEVEASVRDQHIGRAIELINNGLKASLDLQNGGELAQHLLKLYDYMISRLLWASMKNEAEAITETQTLLSELETAWNAMTPAPHSS